jgi:hypothetical protein
MRAHVIENGKVVNTILVESLDQAEALGLVLVNGESAGKIGDSYSGGVFTTPTIIKSRAEMIADVIALCDAIYAKPMLYSKEYELRESEALAYKNAGYSGSAPRVQAYADAIGVGLNAAVDMTLAQASALRTALPLVADARMQKSFFKRNDINDAAANVKYQQVMATLNAIQAQLA